MDDLDILDIYVDGGVIARNPSPVGGTFAWVHVRNNERVRCGSGVILPRPLRLEVVSNNVAELYAALAGILSAPPGWAGRLWTDSMVTYHRLAGGLKWAGIPRELREQVKTLLRGRRWRPTHCGGHPTKDDLERGYDSRGLVVSVWNVFCDRRCGVEAKKFLRGDR